jgi:hypothetical protein
VAPQDPLPKTKILLLEKNVGKRQNLTKEQREKLLEIINNHPSIRKRKKYK